MKPPLQTLLDNLRRQFAVAVSATALAALAAGCGFVNNEEDGDQEPQQGEFRITVSPDTIVLVPGTNDVPITLSVACASAAPGYNPAECFNPAYNVGWHVESSQCDEKQLCAQITNAASATTTARISFAFQDFDPVKMNNLSLAGGGGLYRGMVFDVHSVPQGLTRTGRRRVDAQIVIPGVIVTNQASDWPTNASMEVKSKLVDIRTTDAGAGFGSCVVCYKGAPAMLTDIVKSGPDAARFTFAAPTRPIPLGKNTSVSVGLSFLGTTNTFVTYTAYLTFITDNGMVAGMRVTAQRN